MARELTRRQVWLLYELERRGWHELSESIEAAWTNRSSAYLPNDPRLSDLQEGLAYGNQDATWHTEEPERALASLYRLLRRAYPEESRWTYAEDVGTLAVRFQVDGKRYRLCKTDSGLMVEQVNGHILSSDEEAWAIRDHLEAILRETRPEEL